MLWFWGLVVVVVLVVTGLGGLGFPDGCKKCIRTLVCGVETVCVCVCARIKTIHQTSILRLRKTKHMHIITENCSLTLLCFFYYLHLFPVVFLLPLIYFLFFLFVDS